MLNNQIDGSQFEIASKVMHFWETLDEMPMSKQRISKISIQNEAFLLQYKNPINAQTQQSKHQQLHIIILLLFLLFYQIHQNLIIYNKNYIQLQQSQHKKSQTQTHYTEISSPIKHKKQASNKLYTNIGIDFKQALTQTKSTNKLFKVYTSQSSIPLSANINININQLNMNNLNIKSQFQQYKAMLESPKVNSKKKIHSNVETQRINNYSAQNDTTPLKKAQISLQQLYAQKIKSKNQIFKK